MQNLRNFIVILCKKEKKTQKYITYKTHPMRPKWKEYPEDNRKSGPLNTIYNRNTPPKNLEDYLSYLIWFKKTLP